MTEMTKESKFLDAINQYAEKQKAKIHKEVEQYKAEKIEQATEQGLRDAYELIQGDITRRKAGIVTEAAKKEQSLRRELFAQRQEICEKVFDEVRSKLLAYTKTDDYTEMLKASADKAYALFGDVACTVYVAPFDMDKQTVIQSILTDCEIVEDRQIVIGGIKVYCKARGITADDTLDTKLADQRAWFTEHSGLKVVS